MELRPYQKLIGNHIRQHERCAVWAGMGLGKTVSTLSALNDLSLTEDVFPALILAPKRVAVSVWPEEVKKWAHLNHFSVLSCTGSRVERLRAIAKSVDILTMNYDNAAWLVEELGARWPFKTVIADESTRLKSFRTRQGGVRARALAQIAHTKVHRWINLTGTPSPNGLQDLWGQQWFLDKGERLGKNYNAYMVRWFRQHWSGFGYEALPHAQKEISEKLKDTCLTIKAEDWFDVQQPIVTNLYVDLPMKARKIYKEMEKTMWAQLESGRGVEAFNAAAVTNKCMQVANGAIYYDDKQSWEEIHDEKIQALESVVEETNGVPLLVAYNFKSDLQRLQRAFPQAKTMDAPGIVEKWNAGRVPMLLVHPLSAGHGLNLQHGGNICVYFGLTWNLEAYQQVSERIGPIRQRQSGFNRAVFTYHILARDTIDDLVLTALKDKRNVQDVLLEAMRKRR